MDESKNILVVDDEIIMRDLLTDYLEMFDFHVETAGNGKEAIDKITEKMGDKYFDLVITDINMPIMGGVELYKNIKQTFNNLPVVFMTGFGLEKVKNEIKGADGFLDKPFEMENLTLLISRILKVDLQ